jgi:outer membrane usher protein FimD/PapC
MTDLRTARHSSAAADIRSRAASFRGAPIAAKPGAVHSQTYGESVALFEARPVDDARLADALRGPLAGWNPPLEPAGDEGDQAPVTARSCH